MATSTTVLTDAQREQYTRDGYFVVRKLVPETDLSTYYRRFEDLASKREDASHLLLMWDVALKGERVWKPEAVTKVQDFVLDPVLFGYAQHPAVTSVVRGVIGEEIKAVHTMLINKPPDPGTKTSRHPLHQDLYYFPFRPVEKILAAWTAIAPCTRENGCLAVVPGSHTTDLLEHGYPDWEGGVNGGYHGILNYTPPAELVHLEMEPGDTVFFHPLLVHGSGANRSKGCRAAISAHYASTSCTYIDTEDTVQHGIQEEIMLAFGKRFGQELHYHQIWDMKSRVV